MGLPQNVSYAKQCQIGFGVNPNEMDNYLA